MKIHRVRHRHHRRRPVLHREHDAVAFTHVQHGTRHRSAERPGLIPDARRDFDLLRDDVDTDLVRATASGEFREIRHVRQFFANRGRAVVVLVEHAGGRCAEHLRAARVVRPRRERRLPECRGADGAGDDENGHGPESEMKD
jgi:hypothetical protein